MRTGLLRGLCVAMVCGAWAAAETLEEAIDRLAKAAAETRDVAVKYSLDGAGYIGRGPGEKPVKVRSLTGTAEFQMLRDGGSALLRMAADITMERHGDDPAAAPQKRQEKLISVNDGQFVWTERPRGPKVELRVLKEPIPRRGGLGLREISSPVDTAYCSIGLKADLEQLRQKDRDVKLAGKGAVAGRPTTIFDAPMKAERVDKMDDAMRATMAVRMLVELDDATGATLALKVSNGADMVLLSMTATEVKANSGLDKKLFTYTPPEGVKVEDRTKPPEKQAPPKTPEPEK